MKKSKLIYFMVLSMIATAWTACSDWVEPSEKDYFKERSAEYYEALRAWKKTDHPVSFGWFGNWTGQGASLVNSLMGLPDSVDFVSMWGNWHSLSAEKIADKNEVKRIKGTRVLMCFIVANIGDQTTPAVIREKHEDENGKYFLVNGIRYQSEQAAVNAYWGWEDGNQTAIDEAIGKYAKSLVDTIHKYDWDGFDFDYEANFGAPGNIAGPSTGDHADPARNRADRGNFLTFIKELGKYLGPKSGTNKMLVIDGEPQNMHPDARDYFDYYIIQAYSCRSYSNLDRRYSDLLKGLEATGDPELEERVTKKLIWAENFEDHASKGGVDHTTRQGKTVKSLRGMAMWEAPTGYRKGGIGTYHMEYEYSLPGFDVEYPFLREAMNIINPSMRKYN